MISKGISHLHHFRWFKYDDHLVTEIAEQIRHKTVTEHSIMLFYERVDQSNIFSSFLILSLIRLHCTDRQSQ